MSPTPRYGVRRHHSAAPLTKLTHRSCRMPRIVVDVMPKPEILDPQGKAIVGALPRLGFTSFSSVRQGKRFELTVDGEVTEDILAQARDAAETLLSNPVIEDVVNVEVGEAVAVAAEPRLAGARIGVVTFPGTLDDRDAARAVRLAGATAVELWHGDTELGDVDAVVIPGGFSYGDYLRAGAIARFAPLMSRIIDAANSEAKLPVLGICNGFQILTESHLLPGSMIKNDHLKFMCRDQVLRVENNSTYWTGDYAAGQEI